MRGFVHLASRLAAVAGAVMVGIVAADAQQGDSSPVEEMPLGELRMPNIPNYAPSNAQSPLAPEGGELVLAAHLTEATDEIPRGLIWRIFEPEGDENGNLPMVATSEGGTSAFNLAPGSYLVHAAFGRAGATKRITIGTEPKRETLVLDAGGLKLDAELPGSGEIPPDRLKFSIYEAERDASTGERSLVVPDVPADTVVRLNAGTYHVVSNYGSVNAVIRSDIRVEAGQLTEASVEHRAARLTFKLVREPGGEALADTAWSITNQSGDSVRETVGAYATMVLAAGEYTIIAKNRDRIFRRDFTVEAGENEDVEVLPGDLVEDAGQQG